MAHRRKTTVGQKVRLFQDFVDTSLNRIVVITGSGQTVLSVASVTPEATDDLTGKFVHGLGRLGVHQLKIGSVDRAADGILSVLTLVDHDTAAVHLKDVPVLCLHPSRDGLAAVILRAGNLYEITLLEGSGRLRVRLRRNSRSLIRTGESIELGVLDDGRIVLVGDIGIDIAVDAAYLTSGRTLPHTEGSGIGRSGSPLCQPVIKTLQLGIVEVVLQPVEIAVQGAVETGLFDGVTESDDHIRQDSFSEALLGLVLQVKGYRIGEDAFIFLENTHDIGSFLFCSGHGGSVGIEIAADVDSGLESVCHVLLEVTVEAAGIAISGAVAEADHSKLHAVRFDLVPVDFALPLGNIDTLDGRVDRRRGLLGIGDIRQLAVLRPVTAVVSGDVPVASGDLYLIVPARGAFDRQTVTHIDTDMTFHPDGLTDLDLGKISGYALADSDHAVCANVRDSVGSVGSTTVDGILVTGPTPEDAFDEADTVKAEGVGRGSVDHCGSGGLPVVAVVLGVTLLVAGRHRSTEAAHHIESFVVLCDILELIRKFNVRHHCAHPPFQHGHEAVPERLSASLE